jgi:uncharacterized membrane protein YidH (DUF202 family)
MSDRQAAGPPEPDRSPSDPATAAPPDPGLQAERTGLAWTRTTLALAGNAALIARGGLTTHEWLITGGGIVIGICAAVLAVLGRHHRIVREILGDRHPLEVSTMRLTTAVAVLAAVTVIGSLITSLRVA